MSRSDSSSQDELPALESQLRTLEMEELRGRVLEYEKGFCQNQCRAMPKI